MKTKIYPFLVLLLMLNLSCKDDKPNPDPDPDLITGYDVAKENEKVAKVISAETFVNNFIVDVKDINGNSIENAQVSIGDKTEFTKISGIVALNGVTTHKKYVTVKVKKQGFENSFKTILPSKAKNTITEVILVNAVTAVKLDAKNGGIITKGNITLSFPEKALIDAKGNLFEGTASVKIVNYNPADENFYQTHPGNLIGITSDDKEVGLISEGMLTVEITDGLGNKLQVVKGKKVGVVMPASKNAPESIPLWHLNEKYGLWVETGVAVKKDNYYGFEATHFSTYNLDAKVDNPLNFCVKIKDENGEVYKNSKILIEFKDSFENEMIKQVLTDENGEVCFRNGFDTTYSFYIISACRDKSEMKDLVVNTNGNYEVSIAKSSIPIQKNKTNELIFKGYLQECNAYLSPTNKDYLLLNFNGDYIEYYKNIYDEMVEKIKMYSISYDESGKIEANINTGCIKQSSDYITATPKIINFEDKKIYTYNNVIFNLNKPKVEVNLDLSCTGSSFKEEKVLNYDDYFVFDRIYEINGGEGNKIRFSRITNTRKPKANNENIIIEKYDIFTIEEGNQIYEIPKIKNQSYSFDKFDFVPFNGIYYLLIKTNKGYFIKKFKVDNGIEPIENY